MSTSIKGKKALLYHALPSPGKIKVVPTKKYATQRDLSLAYSPGVAEPCLEIAKDLSNTYKYTIKGNLVAVISNGTAVLGLGNIGPEASKPVMEGKGLLFKIFADIDVFDIEVDTEDIDEFINTVKMIAPTFGGINLEDIKAPEAFEIERRLKDELNIPVMHDDQHGTAIISAAALLNALELTEKNIKDVKIVVSGAGAAAVSCTRLYQAFGAQKENIVMLDSKGVITTKRDNLSPQKAEFASNRDIETLDEAMKDADVFIGLSIANVLTTKMLLSMAKNPIVFAMANPDPEIEYNLAVSTREDIIMATGRSDHPNQVNNVLGFPFIFRGALDVRATKINEEMKKAAVKALAGLAKEPVPEQVNMAYGETRLIFGREYIIPKPFDPRLIATVPVAVAKAAIQSGVATKPIENWEKYEDELYDRLDHDHKLVRALHNRAKIKPKRVVYAEGDQIEVLKAAQIAYDEGIAFPVLLGRQDEIESLMEEIDFDADVKIIDPKSDNQKQRREKYAMDFWEDHKRLGITLKAARKLMRERNYYAAMMVNEGDADALISGYSRSYHAVVKPMVEIIGLAEGVSKIATTNLLMTQRGPMFLSDTAINISPNAIDLANIALMTANVVKTLGLKPVLAMVSFSNFGSSDHEDAVKIREAVSYLHKEHSDLIIDGELQTDFALNGELLKKIFPFSKLAGKKVNTLIFPNLNSANITYKLLKEINKVDSIGPIMMGLKKPAHILPLGANADEIVNMTAVAVIDAQIQRN
ncbi:MAG: NADP-dependent malic enzyme [Flavobacteriaceae bacterium]|nr:NADP-dependent malic enzyme [Flavobacteriaceae bacterium]